MLAAGVRNSAAVVIGQGGAEGMNGDAFPPNRIPCMPDTGLHAHACGMAFLPQARPSGRGRRPYANIPALACPASEASYEAQICAARYATEQDGVYCLLSWSQLHESPPGSVTRTSNALVALRNETVTTPRRGWSPG